MERRQAKAQRISRHHGRDAETERFFQNWRHHRRASRRQRQRNPNSGLYVGEYGRREKQGGRRRLPASAELRRLTRARQRPHGGRIELCLGRYVRGPAGPHTAHGPRYGERRSRHAGSYRRIRTAKNHSHGARECGLQLEMICDLVAGLPGLQEAAKILTGFSPAYDPAFATVILRPSTAMSRWTSISIDVPTSSFTSGPRFNNAQAIPAAAPTP